MKSRLPWLDTLRGLAIICVIIIHATGSGSVRAVLYAFTVPLFFFVAGFTFNRCRFTGWSEFFLKRLRARILPYSIWCLISYMLVIVDKSLNIEWFKSALLNMSKPDFVIGFATGDFNWLTNTINNGPLWFLPCLFLTENIFYLISMAPSTIQIGILVTVFSFSAHYLFASVTWAVPYIINSSATFILFFGTGFLSNKTNVFERLPEREIQLFSIWFVFTAVTIMGGEYIGDRTSITFTVGSFILKTIIAFSGIFAFAVLAKYMENWKWLRYLGINTLIILFLFMPLIRGACDIFSFISLGFFDNLFNCHREIFTFLQVITVMLLLVPCIYIVNKYLPFLIGKQYRNSISKD
jgi:acyltransferase